MHLALICRDTRRLISFCLREDQSSSQSLVFFFFFLAVTLDGVGSKLGKQNLGLEQSLAQS